MALVTVTDFIREILSYQKLNGRFHVLKNFINEQCVHQDETTKEIAGNKLIRRAASGTAKVAAPVEADDIARKAEVDAVADAAADAVGNLQDTIEDGTVVAGAAATIKGHDISIITGTVTFGAGTNSITLDSYSTSQNYAYFVYFSPIQIDESRFRYPDWVFDVDDYAIFGKRLVIRLNESEGYSCNYTV